jgi:hypothetical protein
MAARKQRERDREKLGIRYIFPEHSLSDLLPISPHLPIIPLYYEYIKELIH